MRDDPPVRVVADTNTVVSGLLWHGNPRRVLEAARAGSLQLYTSAALLAEIEEVLLRPKFTQRLFRAGVASHTLVLGYAALASLIEPTVIEPVIIADPAMMGSWPVRLPLAQKRLCPVTATCLT